MMSTALLRTRGLCKHFPGVIALDNVDFELEAGEVHALLGENGAGKSTLIKVLTGAYRSDGGAMVFDGRPIAPRTPGEAQRLGISTVYQEVNLLPNLSVAQNIFLGREPKRLGLIRWREANRLSVELLKRFNLDIDVTRPLGAYSIAIQQLIAIARAVDTSAKVLILDEPTASLDSHEVEQLFAVMRRLKSEGVAVLFVTHFIEQVYAVSDRITVLRNGARVGTFNADALPRRELIEHMLGKELQVLEQSAPENRAGIDENPCWNWTTPVPGTGWAACRLPWRRARRSAWPACWARGARKSATWCSDWTSTTRGKSVLTTRRCVFKTHASRSRWASACVPRTAVTKTLSAQSAFVKASCWPCRHAIAGGSRCRGNSRRRSHARLLTICRSPRRISKNPSSS
jgi:ABC-type branched-subunit amino acid transport system ATPase component